MRAAAGKDRTPAGTFPRRDNGTLCVVFERVRPLLWPLVVVLFAVGAYALLRYKRTELVDFVVPRTAAVRAIDAAPLYRPEDGHYQYKYLPAFAFLMVPFAMLPKETGEIVWFALTVGMTWAFFRVSVRALPDRRTSVRHLIWVTLLLNAKFLIKELAFGQFNLPLGLLLMGAVVASRRRQRGLAGTLVGAAVFVKPYALVLGPWLAWTQGVRSLAAFAAVAAAGLLLPVSTYGWDGNLGLLHEWYRTVAQTTGPNLLDLENISFASMWAKWIGPGRAASFLAAGCVVAAFGLGVAILRRRRAVTQPEYLEGAYFFLLVPLVSPQGWDYVLLLALPASMCLVDRWAEMTPGWRAAATAGFALTSFTIFDLWRRTLYMLLMQWSAASVGAILLALAVSRLRWRALA
jgi:Glycosyltransferase family 87